jgi:hypothetical protein
MRYYPGLLLLVLLAWADPVRGQAVPSKEPSSTHIFPAGGRRGTVVPVRVGAECLPPGARFHLWGQGVSGPPLLGPRAKAHYEPSPSRLPEDANAITYPKEWAAQIAIAADASPGARLWRLSCGWGGTQVRPFIVGDLPEFIETEPNSDPDRAERIALPVTVNGQIAGERDVDCFIFTARAGEVVTADILAGRLGSPLDAVVEFRDKHGRRLPVEEIRVGNDPVVACRIPANGDYLVQIANLSFHGGPEYVYRMTLTTAPYVPFAFPPGGRAGETRDIDLYALSGEGTLRILRQRVAFPAGRTGPFWWHGTLPGMSPVALMAGDLPEVVADEKTHAPSKAVDLPVPATVNSRFLTPAAEDWFRFAARQGEAYSIDCIPFPPGSAAMPTLALEDAKGTALAKVSSVDSPERRCLLEWKAPASETYRLRVRDLQHEIKGGPDFIYRLSVRPARPDFALTLAADYVNLAQGGRAELDVTARRLGGYTGPIDLTVTGLPAGVRAEPARLADNQVTFKLVLQAADDARPTNAATRITGKAMAGSKKVEHSATVAHVGIGVDKASLDSPLPDTVQLTVAHKPVFRLTCNEAYQYGHRGTVYPYKMHVERLNGFNGPIVLQICDRQVQDLDGIQIVETVIPSGVTEPNNLVYLPETMHASVQHHCRPYAQGYAVFKDKWGQEQAVLAVCDKRCMIRTLPPVVKLRAVDEEVVAPPGSSVACKLLLERTSNFPGPMQVELVEPGPDAGFSAEKVRIAAGQTSAVMAVHVNKATTHRADLALRFRATGTMTGNVTVISEATTRISSE